MGGTVRAVSTSNKNLVLVFASALACLFVAGRLWQSSREVAFLEKKLHKAEVIEKALAIKLKESGIGLGDNSTSCGDSRSNTSDYQIDVKPIFSAAVPGLTGPLLDAETIPTVAEDGEGTEPPLLGQLDGVVDGYVHGWACQRGVVSEALRVVLYINGIQIGEVRANKLAPHSIVNRICTGPVSLDMGLRPAMNVAFRFKLPSLPDGYYQMRAFTYHPDGRWRKELYMSPLKFIESSEHPDLLEAIRRKDDIIRARNAQVASLYEVLTTRGAWESVTNVPKVRTFTHEESPTKEERALVFIGVNSDFGDLHHRTYLRTTWMRDVKHLEHKGVIARFIVGKSDSMPEKDISALREEMEEFGDIVSIDIRGYEDAAKKILAFYRSVALQIDADYYFKVEKDVMVNVDKLITYLSPNRTRGNLFMGCMKSGEVITDYKKRWYEPQHYRFGDAIGQDKKLSYPRHAHTQVVGLSGLVAKFLGQNAEVMHGYAHDDVTVGAWLLGLDVEYVDEPKLCCRESTCASQDPTAAECLSFFDPMCTGVCNPEISLKYIYRDCVAPWQQ